MLRDFSLRDFGASLNTVESYTNESSQGKIGLCETVNKQKCTHLGMFLASKRIDMPLSYYAKKYFDTDINKKFIYDDCWGDIILRNEAWLEIENLVPMCEYREMSYLQIAREVLKEQQFVIKGMSSDVEAEWERFWEKVVRLVREYIGIKGY